ncbi:MAG: C45 family autoproteolytic acyltransferase/hydrolase [bacterium]
MKSQKFCVFFLIFLLVALSGKAYKVKSKDGVEYFDKGYLEYKEGIPFLYLAGKPYNVGLQYGVLLKKRINEFYREVDDYKKGMLKRAPWYKRVFARLFSNIMLNLKINSLKKGLPQGYLAQLKGLSDGSGIRLEDILFVTFFMEIIRECSSFIIQAEDGRIVQGRNFDFNVEFLGNYPVVVDYSIENRLRCISIGFIGVFPITTGVNEKGLSYSINLAGGLYSGKDYSRVLEFNRVLETCKNLAEAENLLKGFKAKEGFLLCLGSQEDKSGAIYELLGKDVVRNDMKEGSIYAANRFISRDMQKKTSIYSMQTYNIAREDKFRELSSIDMDNTINQAICILSNTDFYQYKEEPIPSINNFLTLQSVVIDSKNSTIYFAYATHYAGLGRFIRYNYKTYESSVYKEEDERLKFYNIMAKWNKRERTIDWKNSALLKKLVLEIKESGIENLLTLPLLADIYIELGKEKEAKSCIDKIIAKYPDFSLGYEYKAFFYEKKERYQSAIDCYLKALDSAILSEADRAYNTYRLAMLYKKINDLANAHHYAKLSLNLYKGYCVPHWLKKEVNELEKLLK